MNKSQAEYYRVLDLPDGADLATVKQAYRDLVQIWHPDRYSHNARLQKKAEEKLKELNEAYDFMLKFLSSKDSPPDASQSPPRTEEQSKPMEKCPLCAEPLTVDSYYCDFCHTDLREYEKQKRNQQQRTRASNKESGNLRRNKPGGWLVFFCVCLTVIRPLFTLRILTSQWEESKPFLDVFPAFATLLIWEIIGIATLVIYGIFIGIVTWSGAKNGRKLAMQFLKINFLGMVSCQLFVLIAAKVQLPALAFNATFSAASGNMVNTIMFFLVWWFYFMKSKRVIKTYSFAE